MSVLPPVLQAVYSAPKSPLQELQSPFLAASGIKLFMKRDDLLHPEVGGNKWRKLKYNLVEAIHQKANKLITFGGAYSNHIAAVAVAGKLAHIPTLGFIRGEEHCPLNPTLQKARENGMQLLYLNRETYRRKHEPEILNEILKPLGESVFVLPEGGSNLLAVQGCAELVDELPENWDYLCCPAGTGASLAGLIAGSAGKGSILGFPALKGGNFLYDEIQSLQASFSGLSYSNWQLQTSYHFGGYGKLKPELLLFMKDFRTTYNIQLDPVYTGKMMFGIFDLISKGFFPKGSTIIAWHTGGLQGLDGMRAKGIDV